MQLIPAAIPKLKSCTFPAIAIAPLIMHNRQAQGFDGQQLAQVNSLTSGSVPSPSNPAIVSEDGFMWISPQRKLSLFENLTSSVLE